jgi:hypothetical protein
MWAFGIVIFQLLVGNVPSEEQLSLVQHASFSETGECRPQLTRIHDGALDPTLVRRQAMWTEVRTLFEKCTFRDPHSRVESVDVASETEVYATALPGWR